MNFLYPNFLWAFLVLAIPILIHLFNLKRYKTHYFSNIRFLQQVEQQTKSTQKLRRILILLSRMLAFAFLVLAFAHPYFNSDNKPTKNTLLSIYIDNSHSMQAQGTEGELLSQARESVKEIIENAPLGAQFIIATNQLSGVEKQAISKIQAIEKVEKIDYFPVGKDLETVIRWQQGLDENQNYQHFLISDFQKNRTSKTAKIGKTKGQIQLIKLSPQSANNVSVDSVWFASPIQKINAENQLFIRIKNPSEEKIEGVDVNVEVGTFKKSFKVDIPKNGQKITSVRYKEKTLGWKSGSVKISDALLQFDNHFYFSYEVKNKSNVLLIQENSKIKNARIAIELEKFYELTTKEKGQVGLSDFSHQDLVILDGLNEISSGMKNYLINFSKTGGSIALFPGNTPKINEWNQLLTALKLPLITSKTSSGTQIKALNHTSDFVKGIVKKQDKNVQFPLISNAFRSNSKESLGTPIIVMKNGQPLLFQNNTTGNSFMFYSSTSPQWSKLLDDALYPTILLRICELSQRKTPLYLTIGEQNAFPIYTKKTINTPHLISKELDVIPEINRLFGVPFISLAQQNNAHFSSGIYQLNQENEKIAEIALNYGNKESELSYLELEKVKNSLVQMGISPQNINGISSSEIPNMKSLTQKPTPLWKIFIILSIIFVLAEMILVLFWKKHKVNENSN